MFSSFIVPEDRSCLSFGFRLLYSVSVILERRSNGGGGGGSNIGGGASLPRKSIHVPEYYCNVPKGRNEIPPFFFFLKPRFHRFPLSSRSFKLAILRKNSVVSSLFLSFSLSHGIGCKSFFGDIIIFWRV